MAISRQNLSSWLKNGLLMQRQGQLDSARKLYLKALASFPEDANTLYLLGTVEYEQGHTERAIKLTKSAIKADPDNAEYFFSLGELFKMNKQPVKAKACFQKVTVMNPKKGTAFFNLALLCLERGQTEASASYLRQALQATPDLIDAHFALGQINLSEKRLAEAASRFKKVLHMDPGRGDVCFYLGVVCQQEGNTLESLHWFLQAVDRDPRLAEAHLNLGMIYTQQEKIEKALAAYQRALRIDPDMREALNNMGNLYMRLGQADKATRWYEKAVEIHPLFKEAYLNLANCYRKQLRYEDALRCYDQLLMKFPAFEQAFNGTGAVFKDCRKHEKAIVFFLKALESNPMSTIACDNLAVVYNDLGLDGKARAYMDKKTAIKPDFADEVKKAMMLPVIYESEDAVDKCREAFEADLDRLLSGKSVIKDPYRQVGIANFILALHGRNERPLRQKIAQFYLEVCPDLQWTSPWLNTRQIGRKIKIGMVSRFFHNNTIGSLYHGLIRQLSHERFSLTLFRLPGQEDDLSQSMHAAADEVVRLPEDIWRARVRIAEERLDVLFYPELGMDPLTYFIAFSRLAPVQCKRGFQITMGIPTIDYFISSAAAEPPDGQRYYSEKLILLDGTGYYYSRPERPIRLPDRRDFGLPIDRTVYLCPQSLFKLHPAFDSMLAAILKRDTNAVVVLLEGLHPQWKKLLCKRLEKTIPESIGRIHFVPRRSRDTFLKLYSLADAVIDTFPFSGGHTSLECFAWGIPVATLPSAMLPGRLTYGFYKRMGVMDCVAKDQSDYVDIACRLANDLEWRNEISRKIQVRSDILFENQDDVKELEHFFEQAVKAAYSDN